MDKSKVLSVVESKDPATLNITLNGERMEVINSFKYLGRCFSSEGEVKGDFSISVDKGMRTFGAMKRVLGGRSVTLGVKLEL